MTLSEIATLITNKLGRTDSGNANSSVDICKSFINRRYKMIYDNTMWLESLATAVEWVFDRDVTISNNPEVYYSGGSAAKIDRVIAANFAEADVETVNSITVSSPAGIKYQMSSTSGWNVGDTFYAYGFPNTVQALNGKKTVDVVHAEYLSIADPTNLQTANGNYNITGWITADENAFAEITPIDWWKHFKVDPSLLVEQDTTLQTPENFVHLPKDGSGNPRVRLIPGPSKEGLLHVLGKVAWTELTDDDSPVIHGIDEALLAYAEGDMLERGRKYAKAQIKFQEGAALLQAMRQAQVQQFASDPVVIPDIYEESRDTLMFH